MFPIYFRTEPRTSLAERCLAIQGERRYAPFAGQYGNQVEICYNILFHRFQRVLHFVLEIAYTMHDQLFYYELFL